MNKMTDYTFELSNMLDKLFGKRIITLMYVYSIGDFTIYLEGKELEPEMWLDKVVKKYDYIRRNEPKLFKKIKSYEDMIKIIDNEQLYDYIFPQE